FSSRRRHTRSKRDWSSDVCSSDLVAPRKDVRAVHAADELEEILVLERVVEAAEVVLPRRGPLGPAVGLPEIAAGEQLVHLIGDEVVAEATETRAIHLLSLDPAHDAHVVRPEFPAILGEQVQQAAG